MKGMRRLSVVALILGLGFQVPQVVLAACPNINAVQCSNNYGINESEIGGGGPANQATASHSTTYTDAGSNVGDVAVGPSQSGGQNGTGGGDRLADDFENGGALSGWTSSANGGANPAGSITEVNTVQHSGQYALFKNTNADPSGGWKSLTSNVSRDWRIDAWVLKPSTGTNNTVSLGIENSSFSGYSFSLDFGTGTTNIAIQKRTAGTATTLGTAASLALSTNQGYRVILGSNGSSNSLTLSVYDVSGTKLLVQTSQTDSTFTGANDRVVVEGGFTYYLDDLNVYSSGVGYTLGAGFNTSETPVLSVNITAGSADLGVLSIGAAKTATSTFNVKDYNSYGYIVQLVGSAPISRGHELGHMAGNASSPGTEQFGINLVANSAPASFGQDPQQVPSNTFSYGKPGSGYGTPNVYRYNSGDIIAQSLRTSGETDYTMSLVANMSTTTPSGAYAAGQQVIVVPTF
jgi:hypothetical protein